MPKVNPSVERNKFYNTVQEKEEPFEAFVTNLKRIAGDCGVGEFRQEMLSVELWMRESRTDCPGKKI